jgi:hypothetical protein
VRFLALLTVLALGCDPFAPQENPTRTVEGCNEAVSHLRSCCPAWDSYVSCTYHSNRLAAPDLSTEQSRCLAERPCAELERAVADGRRLCGFLPSASRCR